MMKIVKTLALLSVSAACCAGNSIALSQYSINPSVLNYNTQTIDNNKQYSQWFFETEKLYPKIPKGFLAGFAYTTTNWKHLKPNNDSPHDDIKFVGIMGLMPANDVGFRDTLTEVAKSYGLSNQEMLQDPRLEILATADFVNKLMQKGDHGIKSLEEMQPIAEYISGLPIPQSNKSDDVDAFVMNSLFYDVLLINQKGHDDKGLNIPSKHINMQKAFTPAVLSKQQVSLVNIDVANIKSSIIGYQLDLVTQTLKPIDDGVGATGNTRATTDYPPAIWSSTTNHSSRGSASITHIAIHRMEGYYASSIALFKRSSKQVSAHYLLRSSDGQVTQMVKEYRKAWHIGANNRFTIGLEHEGFSRNDSKLSDAMYNSSANLVRNICSRQNINCEKTYDGPGNRAHRKDVLPKSRYTVKGHAHFPTGTHWDPGPFWNWSRFYNLINGTNGGGGNGVQYTILDSFEGSEGHFDSKPTHSGSTRGISSVSFAERSSHNKRNGNYAEQIKLVDDSNTNEDWRVRFLSGSGRPSNNVSMQVNDGTVGFWVYAGGSGMSVGLSVDDSDGTEQSDTIALPTREWTFVSWKLDQSSLWNTWVGGNGRLDATNVTLDAIWFHRSQTAYNVFMYIDDVQYFR